MRHLTQHDFDRELARLADVLMDALFEAKAKASVAPLALAGVAMTLSRGLSETHPEMRLCVGQALVDALRDQCPELFIEIHAPVNLQAH